MDDPTPDMNGDQSAVEAYLNHQWNRQAWGRTPPATREAAAERARAKRQRRAENLERRKTLARARRRISKGKRQRIYKRDGYRCVVCGAHRDQLPAGTQGLTLDHIVPVARGGTNRDSNLQTMCGPCNVEKGCDPITSGPRESHTDVAETPGTG